MDGERELGKLSNDSKDRTRDTSYENGILVDETDFSDPEDFVDKISDDGLWHVALLTLVNFTRVYGAMKNENDSAISKSARTTVPIVTVTLQYMDFDAQSMVLGLGLRSVGSVGLVG